MRFILLHINHSVIMESDRIVTFFAEGRLIQIYGHTNNAVSYRFNLIASLGICPLVVNEVRGYILKTLLQSAPYSPS